MWSAQRLLSQLQVWLQARHRGVLALELEWTLDLRRLNGVSLPSHEQLTVRTAQPTQDISHLRRLVGEHLSRATLAAPANHLRLRTLGDMVPGWSQQEPAARGQRERRAAAPVDREAERAPGVAQCRGAAGARADHRPERMQVWKSAAGAHEGSARLRQEFQVIAVTHCLAMASIRPGCCHSPCGWKCRARNLITTDRCVCSQVPSVWKQAGGTTAPQGPALRDYFIARSDEAGLCGCIASG